MVTWSTEVHLWLWAETSGNSTSELGSLGTHVIYTLDERSVTSRAVPRARFATDSVSVPATALAEPPRAALVQQMWISQPQRELPCKGGSPGSCLCRPRAPLRPRRTSSMVRSQRLEPLPCCLHMRSLVLSPALTGHSIDAAIDDNGCGSTVLCRRPAAATADTTFDVSVVHLGD